MAFQKGKSGNEKGRPKQTEEQKVERNRFRNLLKAATIPALENIIAIAFDEKSKDRFSACKFLIEKAYGANFVFLSEGEANELSIQIIRHSDEMQ